MTTCAAYKYVRPADGLTYVSREVYNFAAMQALRESDPNWDQFAAAKNLPIVQSCADARLYNQWRVEYEEAKPPLLADGSGAETSVGPTSSPRTRGSESEPLIEKVFDSASFAYSPAVLLRFFDSSGSFTCSGYMIKARRIITAAHCIPGSGSGYFKVTVESSSGCAYPVGASCTTPPSTLSFAHINGGWPGGTDTLHDVGAVELTNNPAPPLDSSSGWLRLAVSATVTNQELWLVGWGSNQQNGSGAEVERISNHDIGIDWAGPHHFLFNAVSGEGRQCDGDSGGPMIATDQANFDVVMGHVSNSNVNSGQACTCTGCKDRHVQMSDNIGWIEGFYGPCTQFAGFGSFLYKRCF